MDEKLTTIKNNLEKLTEKIDDGLVLSEEICYATIGSHYVDTASLVALFKLDKMIHDIKLYITKIKGELK